ncbi:chemotaxis protein CheA [Bacillus gobiensis]|uniref:chemotaxis protein CheW n=1 Tax=Bacillus gobiensis TaxID=1441095 RepID=UPI003D19001A
MELNQYLDVFIEEGREHLQACNEKLLLLEKEPGDIQLIHDFFRSAHTLKGMSATMGFEDMAQLTHHLENVLDRLRNEEAPVSPEKIDLMFEALDHLEDILQSIIGGGDGKKHVGDICAKLNGDETSSTSQDKPLASGSIQLTFDNFEKNVINEAIEQGYAFYQLTVSLKEDCLLKAVRVYMVFEQLNETGEVIKTIPDTEALETENFESEFTMGYLSKQTKDEVIELIHKVSEIDAVRAEEIRFEEVSPASNELQRPDQVQQAEQPVDEKSEVKKTSHSGTKTIRVNIDRLDSLMNLFEELVIDRGRLEQISKEINHQDLSDTVERMTRISGDLQSIILKMRMVPVETVFNRFPRMIRQLSKDLEKKIELTIDGADTELDRTVIDEIGDPLLHLLRNSIDHGIETQEVRKKNGKSDTGKVSLKAYHSGNHVFIEVKDDGAGINTKKVLEKAIAKNIVTDAEAESMSKNEIESLIFAPGFSTAEKISDISGRGVGLDVVKSKLESLGGMVTIESTEGEGSLFSIQLPLTLSIISVLLIKLGSETYAIPISSIIETAVIEKQDILYTHDREVIDFRGQTVPLVYLKEQFSVERISGEAEQMHIIVVQKGEKLTAFVVDSFIGQQEVVLKSVGDYLSGVFAISGATILGDGQVALIVDCNALIK